MSDLKCDACLKRIDDDDPRWRVQQRENADDDDGKRDVGRDFVYCSPSCLVRTEKP